MTSTFLQITPRSEVSLAAGELRAVEGVVRAAFAHRRKTIVNSLRTAAAGSSLSPQSPQRIAETLASHGIDRRARAQSLSPEQWLEIAGSLAKAGAV